MRRLKARFLDDLSQSIAEKMRAEQESERMQFILSKEKSGAERKRIVRQIPALSPVTFTEIAGISRVLTMRV